MPGKCINMQVDQIWDSNSRKDSNFERFSVLLDFLRKLQMKNSFCRRDHIELVWGSFFDQVNISTGCLENGFFLSFVIFRFFDFLQEKFQMTNRIFQRHSI